MTTLTITDTGCGSIAGSMLGQHLWRWPSIEPTLDPCPKEAVMIGSTFYLYDMPAAPGVRHRYDRFSRKTPNSEMLVMDTLFATEKRNKTCPTSGKPAVSTAQLID